ncbi:MAG: EF-hand domain-containing protein [Bacteroidota bacterium]
MQISSFFRFSPLLLSVFLFNSLAAQNQVATQEVSLWFLEERFLLTDQNDDALLARSELESFSDEFCYYLEGRNFELADINQDGLLSFNEMLKRVKSENIYQYQLNSKELRALAREYPLLAQADAAYLRKNPKLVETLFGNLVWMYENGDLAKKIYRDKAWLETHPTVSLALHKNLRWMASNPREAKSLYRNREVAMYMPELLSWRSDHQAFIRKNPKLDELYPLGYFQTGIQINR